MKDLMKVVVKGFNRIEQLIRDSICDSSDSLYRMEMDQQWETFQSQPFDVQNPIELLHDLLNL